MKKDEIVRIIKNIEEQYKSYKDGGTSFISHLARKVLNSVDADKSEVMNFFLDEISSNEYGFCEISLQTIIEMNALEYAPYLENIYNIKKDIKNDAWKHSIIEALMKLRYKEPMKLYADYVTSFIVKKPDDAFFILVQFCNVNPELALPMLSEFYVKNLFRNTEMRGFLESRIGFLFSYFIQNPIDYFPELIKQTVEKNRDVGLHLKELLLKYLSSEMTNQYPKALINDRIEALKK